MSIESIDAARALACSILKHTGKQLAHGLELHKRTLVAESYSHFLQAPLNHEELIHAAQAGASPVKLQDMREDMEAFGWRTYFDEPGPYEMAWDASGVNCSFISAGEKSNHPQFS